MVRVIGGDWKRTPVPVIPGNGLRPTPSRVRETLFNWLEDYTDLNGAVFLDLFCGSGILGLEALSRGASSVSFVDSNKNCLDNIEKILVKLKARGRADLFHDKAFSWLEKQDGKRYDCVFFDPPFDDSTFIDCLLKVRSVVGNESLCYIENKQPLFSILEDFGLKCIKSSKAGVVHYGLFKIK